MRVLGRTIKEGAEHLHSNTYTVFIKYLSLKNRLPRKYLTLFKATSDSEDLVLQKYNMILGCWGTCS